MIEAVGLKKSFSSRKGRIVAVDGLSFTAPNGHITGLLGPNGAGKTTTLRMLYTLMRPEAGTIRVDGLDAATQPDQVRRRLGVLPDARGVYKRWTARENITYFAELNGLTPEATSARTAELVSALGLADVIDRRAEGFSQGQRTKTALARALIHSPTNVILDEPTNGLDVMTTRGLREFFRRLRSEGCCVLFSSHIMQEVAALCDSIVVIAAGRAVACGSPEELKARTGELALEDAFVKLIGSGEGLMS